YMYYHASEEDAVQFHSKYTTTSVSNLSAEIKRTINDNIMAIGKDMVEQSRRQYEELACRSYMQHEELTKLSAIVKSSRGNDEMKQEFAELKEHVASSRVNDKVEQELAELKGLVKELMSELRSKNAPS
ncbi:hypothetical protein BGZ65_012911, partial [Modicella reniformis]